VACPGLGRYFVGYRAGRDADLEYNPIACPTAEKGVWMHFWAMRLSSFSATGRVQIPHPPQRHNIAD
jgi:hypothetical protein